MQAVVGPIPRWAARRRAEPLRGTTAAMLASTLAQAQDRVRIGDSLMVRLPSGEERKGVVIYRGVDAGFATQRDVSRSKRDIKTFEIRVRVDNKDRRLAVGMTAYVLLPPRVTHA